MLHELEPKLGILVGVLLDSTGAARVALARLFEDIMLWLTLIGLHVLRLGPLLGLDIYVLNVASFLLGLENC